MSSGSAQDKPWKSKEQADEARYIQAKEKAQLESIRHELQRLEEEKKQVADRKAQVHKEQESVPVSIESEHDIEGGFGGQEDLEDRYATTSGEH